MSEAQMENHVSMCQDIEGRLEQAPECSNKKSMCFIWGGGDIQGVMHYEFVPQKLKINIAALTPCSVCEKMCSKIHPKSGILRISFSAVI
jgi:hypothetical protein